MKEALSCAVSPCCRLKDQKATYKAEVLSIMPLRTLLRRKAGQNAPSAVEKSSIARHKLFFCFRTLKKQDTRLKYCRSGRCAGLTLRQRILEV